MKYLFLGCHCDDIELGCGATIHKKSKCHDVFCAVFSHDSKLKKISKKSLKHLGAKNNIFFNFEINNFWKNRQEIWEEIKKLEEQIKPDIIFTHYKDEHQDHEILHNETIRNFKSTNIILYRPSMSYKSTFFNNNYLEKISFKNLNKKIKSIKLYTNYSKKNYCKKNNIISQARSLGMSSNLKYCESFEVYRIVKN